MTFDRRTALSPTVKGAAISWLRDRGIRVDELAEAFEVSPAHARILHHRASRRKRPDHPRLKLASVRGEEDAVVLRSDQLSRIEKLTDRVEEISAATAAGGDLDDAVRRLGYLMQFVGFPSSVKLKRLRARILQQQAWCLVHLGSASAALQSAQEAAVLYRQTQRHSALFDDLVRIGETTLIASQASLSLHYPEVAVGWLDVHKQAHAASGEPLNVEYFRQRGTCAVLAHHSDQAVHYYQRAGVVVKDVEEDWWIAHASERPLSVLTADWDLAVHALESVRSARPSGLESAIATVWACGAATLHGANGAADWADKMLGDSTDLLAPFRRQQQIAFLIRAGLRCEFARRYDIESAQTRVDWIRWVLYRAP